MKEKLPDASSWSRNANDLAPTPSRRHFVYGLTATCLPLEAVSALALRVPVGQEGIVSGSGPKELASATTLWFDRPATDWSEALPVGNGRIGATISGGVDREELWLNEETLYSEEAGMQNLPLDIQPEFDEVLGLIKQGKYREAEAIVTRKWLGRGQPCYEPLGKLTLQFDGVSPVQDYVRELALVDAVQRTRYLRDGARFQREVFASAVDDVVIYRVRSDKAKALHLNAYFCSPHPNAIQQKANTRDLKLTGQVPGFVMRRPLETIEQWGDQWKYPELWNEDGSRKAYATQILYGEIGNRGLAFEARLRVLHCDGAVQATDEKLSIQNATEVVFALAMASNFDGFDRLPKKGPIVASSRTIASLAKTKRRTFEQLLERHTADYQRLFKTVDLKITSPTASAEQAKLPTDKRRLLHQPTTDPDLAVLYFQYGRYLMISSSRRGTQPANLQGIWNIDRNPSWASGYTTNINLEMNYWGAYPTGLAECQEPLFELMKECAVTGAVVAHEMYHRPGWVLHHNTTIWRDAQPVDYVGSTSFWPMGSGWLCQHLWEHYRYSMDLSFLRDTAYPLLKGATDFYDSWLVEDESGHLVTPISDSPENLFIYKDSEGKEQIGGMAMGCTLDMAIIREVFSNTIAAAELLSVDADFANHLRSRVDRLLPYRIGSRGQLLEYYQEFKEVPPRHNTSPIYPLFPGWQITPRGTPALAGAERVLIIERAKHGGGWPAALMAAAWSRLGEGEIALGYLVDLLVHTRPNLLNGGKVFQIDGNLGGMAATAEMLVQSHTGELELLPALPKAWAAGSVSGLRARGGCVVDIVWNEGRLSEFAITASRATEVTVRYGERTTILRLNEGESRRLNATLNSV